MLWSSSLFGAAAPLACESKAKLRARVRECAANMAYADAGKACLARYDAAIAASREAVATSLKNVLSSDKQAESLEHAKKGYGLAIESLKSLVAQGRALKKQVEAYKKEVVWPEDFGASGLSARVFLEGQSCYSATQKLVTSYADLLGLHARELELTAQIAEELSMRAFRGEEGLKVEDLAPLLSTEAALKRRKSKPGKEGKGPKTSQSDITGTDRKKTKK